MNKRHLTASALRASALVLTACGSGGNDTAAGTGNGGTAAAETAKGNDADVAFLTGITPHHEQAVEMSEMVLAADPPAPVAAIAMMSDADMDALMNATGADAARLYFEGMVKHRRGAIDASDTEIADGQYQPAVDLAQKIKAAQQAEITEMQDLLKTL